MSQFGEADDRCEPSEAQARLAAVTREIASIRRAILRDEPNVIQRVQVSMDLNMAIGRLVKVRAAIAPQQTSKKRRVS